MLSQTRPKSQPPLKFSSIKQSDDDQWNQLIERYKVNLESNKLSEIEKSSKELELSSESSLSSSSSLASSSLSISTNSSTSTVLAALNTMHINRNKSMIARYSSSAATTASKNLVESAKKQLVANDEMNSERSEEDEEDSNQTLSSSSSSSSSGLSSMNSSTNNSQDGYSISLNLQQEPTNLSNNYLDSDYQHELEVEKCLGQLVDSVAEQADNEIEYKTFQLHEAIMAQTRSNTTSGSSDDDSSAGTLDTLRRPSTRLIDVAAVREAYLVRAFELRGENKPSEASILQLARGCISSALQHQQRQASEMREPSWSVSLRADECYIEWSQQSKGDDIHSTVERVKFAQINNCLVDQQLVVWILNSRLGFDHHKSTFDSSGAVLNKIELETTLDDIALALDEPISHNNNNGDSFAIGYHDSDVYFRAVVWLCSSDTDAKWFCDAFQVLDKVNKRKSSSGQKDFQSINSHPLSVEHVEESGEIDDSLTFSASQLTGITDDLVSKLSKQQQVDLVRESESSATKSSGGIEQIQGTKSAHAKIVHLQARVDFDGRRALETPAASSSFRVNNDQMKVTEKIKDSSSKLMLDAVSSVPRPLDASLKRNKKSASGLDLSQSSSTSTSSGLARYYRNVASKVISNGQNKIKNFKDEMIKLNQRLPSSSSSTSISLKRNSLAIHSDRSPAQVNGHLNPSESVRNLSSLDLTNEVQHGGDDHLRRRSTNIAAVNRSAEVKLNQPKLDRQIPAIKPRTSILKNQQQNNGCDLKNNLSHNKNDLLKQQTVNKQLARNDKEQSRLRRDIAGTTIIKPKSILKSSKSVSNILTQNEHSQFSPKYRNNDSAKSVSSLSEKEQNQVNHFETDHTTSSYSQSHNWYSSNGDSVEEYQRPIRSIESNEKRRSTYSMIGEGRITTVDENRQLDDSKHDKIKSSKRDQVFERIGQRASCYDISRLMSSNTGLQSQLNELRLGSTNSVTGKSRQRRPALLLDETSKDDHLPDTRNDRNADNVASVIVKTTSSGADGTVRARVIASQLKSNVENSSSTNLGAKGGRRQQQLNATGGKISVEEPAPRIKKSEFDPRSLRKPPTAYQSPPEVEDGRRQVELSSRHKSITSIRVTSQRETPQDNSKDKANRECAPVTEQTRREQVVDVAAVSSNEDSSTEDEAPSTRVTSSSLSKSGPFNLLRQSFNQKTLSSMLRFSGRASLRLKPAAVTATENDPNANKTSAIAIAEANLIAAKQLKQQAQKLKEQQKREQQQASLDPTSMMLAAVQYNQIQRQQQQQQQQQIMYQQAQQYAVAARGHLFDASSVHMQHQMLIQRHHQQQQQQQLAYMANINSAHYMAQQLAVMGPPNPMVPMAPIQSQQLMYVQPQVPIQTQQLSQPSSSIFRKSILKGSNKQEQPSPVYQPQAGRQMIPVTMNHHSSFNIVYSGSSSSQIPLMHDNQHQQPIYNELPIQSTLSKHSSLGASMRKTVKSILINKSSFLSNSNNLNQVDSETQIKPKLKSALKSAVNRDIVLNSEGSDGDGSSSDSTTINSSSGGKIIGLPKSALKKSNSKEISSASSDSSYSSANGYTDFDHNIEVNPKNNKSNLTRSLIHRQSVKSNGDHYQTPNSVSKISKQKTNESNGRKNVTFSTKLTSIL